MTEFRTPDYWRVAIVEDHLLQRRHTEELIAKSAGMRVVYSAETYPQFTAWFKNTPRRERPHLLILDLLVERGPSVDCGVLRQQIAEGLHVLVLSAMAAPHLVREVLRAGVGGIVGKRDSEDDIIAAAWTVLGAKTWMTNELASVLVNDASRPKLSDQEERALVLYASGLTLKAVAQSLGVKPDTAKKYLDRVRTKYSQSGREARTKLELNQRAVEDGYLEGRI